MGFNAWRRAIRNECKRLHAARPASCEWAWVSMKGSGAPAALSLYASSTFCLQPPGDTLARSGIVDAISLGCIPVLFHPAQLELWPHHWNASAASVTFDWTAGPWAYGAPQPLIKDPAVYAARAASDLASLLAMPARRVAALRRAVADAARSLVYASREAREDAPRRGATASAGERGSSDGSAANDGSGGGGGAGDAVEVLVLQMRALRLEPSEAEVRAHAMRAERQRTDRALHRRRRADLSAWLVVNGTARRKVANPRNRSAATTLRLPAARRQARRSVVRSVAQ